MGSLIKRRRAFRIFPGWWTVLTGGILSIWAGGFLSYGFSALFKPLSSELGFNRMVTSIAGSIARLEGGIEGPVIGWLTDRFGPRWIVLSGVFLVGLGLVLMNYIYSLWAFYLVWGVMLGTAQNITTTLPMHAAVANWFVRKRGKAVGIHMTMAGFGGVLTLPFAAWLITAVGWRMTCFIFGIVTWLIGFPLVWFFVKKHRPEYYGLLPDGTTPEEKAEDKSEMIQRGVEYAATIQELEFTFRQAMRTPTFWMIVTAVALNGLATSAVNIHGIPFLTDIGIDPLKAAGMIALMVFAGVPFRLVSGVLSDYIKVNQMRFLAAGAYLLQALGFAVFLLNQQSIAMIYVWFILYGMGQGASMALMSPLRGRYFGRKAFGSIQGMTNMLSAPVGMIAPIYAGWVYDTTGSYITAFTLMALMLAFSAVFMSGARPPKPPAHITDIHKIV